MNLLYLSSWFPYLAMWALNSQSDCFQFSITTIFNDCSMELKFVAHIFSPWCYWTSAEKHCYSLFITSVLKVQQLETYITIMRKPREAISGEKIVIIGWNVCFSIYCFKNQYQLVYGDNPLCFMIDPTIRRQNGVQKTLELELPPHHVIPWRF